MGGSDIDTNTLIVTGKQLADIAYQHIRADRWTSLASKTIAQDIVKDIAKGTYSGPEPKSENFDVEHRFDRLTITAGRFSIRCICGEVVVADTMDETIDRYVQHRIAHYITVKETNL